LHPPLRLPQARCGKLHVPPDCLTPTVSSSAMLSLVRPYGKRYYLTKSFQLLEKLLAVTISIAPWSAGARASGLVILYGTSLLLSVMLRPYSGAPFELHFGLETSWKGPSWLTQESLLDIWTKMMITMSAAVGWARDYNDFDESLAESVLIGGIVAEAVFFVLCQDLRFWAEALSYLPRYINIKALYRRAQHLLALVWRKVSALAVQLAHMLSAALSALREVLTQVVECLSQCYSGFMESTWEQKIAAVDYCARVACPFLTWYAWGAFSNGNSLTASIAVVPACYGYYLLAPVILECAGSVVEIVYNVTATCVTALGVGVTAFMSAATENQAACCNATLCVTSPFIMWHLVRALFTGDGEHDGDADEATASINNATSSAAAGAGKGGLHVPKWLVLGVPLLVMSVFFLQFVLFVYEHCCSVQCWEKIFGCMRQSMLGVWECLLGMPSFVLGLLKGCYRCTLSSVFSAMNGVVRQACQDGVTTLKAMLQPIWDRLPPRVKDVLRGVGKCLCALPAVMMAFLEDSMLGSADEDAAASPPTETQHPQMADSPLDCDATNNSGSKCVEDPSQLESKQAEPASVATPVVAPPKMGVPSPAFIDRRKKAGNSSGDLTLWSGQTSKLPPCPL